MFNNIYKIQTVLRHIFFILPESCHLTHYECDNVPLIFDGNDGFGRFSENQSRISVIDYDKTDLTLSYTAIISLLERLNQLKSLLIIIERTLLK